MSGGQRAVLIVVAAVIAVGAFLILRPDDEDSGDDTPSTAATQTQTQPELTTPSETQPQPKPQEPEIETLRVKNGKIVGGLATLEAQQGDTVRFEVTSDAEHEIHLHGYDVSEDVSPEKPATFRVKADETGIFEIEIEDTHTQIAELKVEP